MHRDKNIHKYEILSHLRYTVTAKTAPRSNNKLTEWRVKSRLMEGLRETGLLQDDDNE